MDSIKSLAEQELEPKRKGESNKGNLHLRVSFFELHVKLGPFVFVTLLDVCVGRVIFGLSGLMKPDGLVGESRLGSVISCQAVSGRCSLTTEPTWQSDIYSDFVFQSNPPPPSFQIW